MTHAEAIAEVTEGLQQMPQENLRRAAKFVEEFPERLLLAGAIIDGDRY